jgi:hypothetical protein
VTVESEPTTPEPPGPVRASFWTLIASAVIRVIFAIITIASWNAFVNEAVQHLPAHTTAEQMRGYAHTVLTENIIVDLVFGGLWVLFAYLIRNGRNWARLTLTVIVVVFGIFDILNGTDLYTLISVLIELVAVGMLYLPASREYYAATKAAKQIT